MLAACGSSPGAATTPAKTPGATTAPAAPTTAATTPAVATAAATTAPAVMSANRIAYGVRAGDSSNVFSVEPDGTDARQLTSGAGNHLCAAYSADRSLIAYCADSSGTFEIWTMHPDGSAQTQLTHLGGRSLFPDFSRDGKKIAYGGTQGDDPNTEVYVVDAARGEHPVALTSCKGLKPGCSNDFPAWSPDDQHIVYIHTDDFDENENAVNAQVWVMDADGKHPHPLTSGSEIKDQVPDWSPDGKHIVYASNAGPNEGIWVMDADGSDQVQLTGCKAGEPSPCAAGADFGPVWSPDGTQIAFLRSFIDLGPQDRPIYVMDADGSNQHRLLEGTILQAVPAWQ
jgi:Tol biopolymer transport system component